MRGRIFLISTALAAVLELAACGTRGVPPAPVMNFGVHPDSVAGAVMVQDGDTLWRISQRYRLPLRDIIDLNGMTPPYALHEGMRLRLPPPLEHKVGQKDTLYNLSRMYAVPVSQLVRINRLQSPYRLRIGQTIRIPSSRARVEVAEQVAARRPIVPLPSPPTPRHRAVSPAPMSALLGGADNAARRETAPVVTTLAGAARPGFVWPVRGKVISSYGPKAGGLYNEGINIAAPRGTPVVSAADGVVAYVGSDLGSYGNLVLVRHAGGMVSAYAHLGTIGVSKGNSVRKGQPIGTVGSSGTVSNAQLHFEVRRGAETLDPLRFLG